MRRKGGFTLVEIMIVVAIIGILIAIAVPGFLRARETARARNCAENLQKIDGAVEQYALDYHLSNGDTTIADDWTAIVGQTSYIKRLPICPSGGGYGFGTVGLDPLCSLGYDYTAGGILPPNVRHAIPGLPAS